MKKGFKFICLLLCVCLLMGTLTQCTRGKQGDTQATDGSAANTTDPSNETDATQGEVPELDNSFFESLGLCFTEGHFVNRTLEAVKQRFQDYLEMGLKTVRYETRWVSLSKGSWVLSGEDQDVLQAAIDAGLRLKLISPTIMNPQSWAMVDPNASLYNYNMMKAQNTMSYWYDGIYDYTSDAINGQLAAYKEMGMLDSIDALIVDFGPAGEPLYPAAWTQTGNLENPDNASTSMWCYGENAVADFRVKMLEKYGDIGKINAAWGTSLASMDEFAMPLPGTVKGQQWRDVLTWYLESKRVFVEKQIQIFKEAVSTYSGGRIQLILYMPGASFTQAELDECVETGDATFAMLIGSENEFIVDMAAKYGCIVQFTGLPGLEPLKQVRQYMYENGYGSIPCIGENYADYASSCDPEALYQVIEDLNLAGLDYTFSKFLYEEDGLTHSSIYEPMAQTLPKLREWLHNADFSAVPQLLRTEEAKPEGDVLAMRVKLDEAGDSATIRCRLAMLDYQIQEGDMLEYDVKLSAPVNGFGFVDGVVDGAGRLQSMPYCTDQFGILAAPTESLAYQAGGKWLHRIVGIDVPYNTSNPASNTTGKLLRDLTVLAKPHKINGAYQANEVEIYYDNIVITNGGEVKLVIFRSGGDIGEVNILESENAAVDVKVETL